MKSIEDRLRSKFLQLVAECERDGAAHPRASALAFMIVQTVILNRLSSDTVVDAATGAIQYLKENGW